MGHKITNAKRFLAALPPQLHAALREAAIDYAKKNGGQVNLNREIIRSVYAAVKDRLSAQDRARVEAALL